MTTLETLTAKQAELQEALETAKRRKKGTKTLREQLDEVTAQVEQATREAVEDETQETEPELTKKHRGRPRKYSPEFYTLRESFRRGQRRGRPTREQVVTDLQRLGVEVTKDANFRELEAALKEARAKALEAAK